MYAIVNRRFGFQYIFDSLENLIKLEKTSKGNEFYLMRHYFELELGCHVFCTWLGLGVETASSQ